MKHAKDRFLLFTILAVLSVIFLLVVHFAGTSDNKMMVVDTPSLHLYSTTRLRREGAGDASPALRLHANYHGVNGPIFDHHDEHHLEGTQRTWILKVGESNEIHQAILKSQVVDSYRAKSHEVMQDTSIVSEYGFVLSIEFDETDPDHCRMYTSNSEVCVITNAKELASTINAIVLSREGKKGSSE